MTGKITKRQQAVLDNIEKHIRERGFGPTVREVCQDLGLSSPSTVHVHLKALEEKGYIKRDKLKSRSISLTYDVGGVTPGHVFNVINIPLVGDVAAGQPILAEENITEHIALPVEIVGDSASFVLNVRGDSMIEAGINDGDYVVVKEQSEATNGEIIVAITDEGATVKRFFQEDGHIRLQPENSSMEPIIVDNCSVAGKVVAVFRRL
jgi:repressor LexA